jgi:hypothetical protein
MGALIDLWKSERGLVAIALIAACTVLCVVNRITVDQWLEYTKFVFVAYAAAKTVTATAAILKTAPGPSVGDSLLGSLLSSLGRPIPTDVTPPTVPAAPPAPPAS